MIESFEEESTAVRRTHGFFQMGLKISPEDRGTVLVDSLESVPFDSIAVDFSWLVYNFSFTYRINGKPFRDIQGRNTSLHFGLCSQMKFFSSIGKKFIFVLDGKPPLEKEHVLSKRRAIREKLSVDLASALLMGDLLRIEGIQSRMPMLEKADIEYFIRFILISGFDIIVPEGEADLMVRILSDRKEVDAVLSTDLDFLCCGVNIVNFKTVLMKDSFFLRWRITREEFVKIVCLIGSDYGAGIKGIGFKKAVKIVKDGAFDYCLSTYDGLSEHYSVLKRIYLEPQDLNFEYYTGEYCLDEVVRTLSEMQINKKLIETYITALSSIHNV